MPRGRRARRWWHAAWQWAWQGASPRQLIVWGGLLGLFGAVVVGWALFDTLTAGPTVVRSGTIIDRYSYGLRPRRTTGVDIRIQGNGVQQVDDDRLYRLVGREGRNLEVRVKQDTRHPDVIKAVEYDDRWYGQAASYVYVLIGLVLLVPGGLGFARGIHLRRRQAAVRPRAE